MRSFIFTLVLVLASGSAYAEKGQGPQDGKDGHKQRMRQELNLTDEQVEQMREIREQGGSREEMRAVLNEEQRAKADKMRQQRRGSKEERRARMKAHLELSEEQVAQIDAIHAEGGSRDEVRAVLTPEQQAKWDDMRARHKGPGKGKGKNRPAGEARQGNGEAN